MHTQIYIAVCMPGSVKYISIIVELGAQAPFPLPQLANQYFCLLHHLLVNEKNGKEEVPFYQLCRIRLSRFSYC